MDPPEENVELTSLLKETIGNDAPGADGGDFLTSSRTTTKGGGGGGRSSSSSSSSSLSLSLFRSSIPRELLPTRRQGVAASSNSTMSSSSSNNNSTNENDNVNNDSSNNGNNNNNSSNTTTNLFYTRVVLVLLILAGFAIILVLIDSKTERSIEDDGVVDRFQKSKTGGGSARGRGGNAGGGAGGNNNNNNNEHDILGFHSPSMESIYTNNRYYKPRGLGYVNAPRGGLHPLYMIDLTSDERATLGASEEYDNENGDDYEFSPYADVRLEMTEDERKAEREAWSRKLKEIREEYGYWEFDDDDDEEHSSKKSNNKGKKVRRPTVDWIALGEKKKGAYDYDDTNEYGVAWSGEIDPGDFPPGSWQTDPTYVSSFLTQARALVKRVRRSIYDEYGWNEEEYANGGIQFPDSDDPVKKGGNGKTKNVAWMYEESVLALSRKLLRAMMTNDHFYVTLGGHSAAAGHGNNFLQSYMMEFQRVMEPVFDRLGMVLVSSNLAQGGMGTLQLALAGSGIYGVKRDFMIWDSSMTERDGRAQDVFLRQMLLSGETVPILFDMGGGRAAMDKIRAESGAHVGGAAGGGLFPEYKNTTVNFSEKKYNAACWTGRIDVPDHDVQYEGYGGQKSFHPGNYVHQSSARKITLVFLRALDEALTLWEEKATAPKDEGGGIPLDGRYWHLREEDKEIRRALKSTDVNATGCGQMFGMIQRLCTTPMRGAGEWTPRRDPDRSSIRALAKPAEDGYVPGMLGSHEQLYVTRDVLQPQQRVPMGEVDVAMVARSLPPMTRRRGKRSRSLLSRPTSFANNTHSKMGLESPVRAHHVRRHLDGDTKIVPGQGWTVEGHPLGFCDGTSNSECYREKTNHCLMSGHNDARGVMKGDGLSGWLVLQLKDVTEGIFMSRMESYHDYNSNARTRGWTTVNNRTEEDGGRQRRELKNEKLPETWQFELAVNGVLQYSWNSTEYRSHCYYLAYNNDICVLWDDESRANSSNKKKEDVEIAMRLRGEGGRTSLIAMTHVYYA